MTFDELYEVRDLRDEIRQLTQTRAQLRRELPTCAEFPELERCLEEKRARLSDELMRLETYIDTIPNSFTRRLFRYRFTLGLSWEAVAWRMGGNNTADSVKKYAQRHIVREKERRE